MDAFSSAPRDHPTDPFSRLFYLVEKLRKRLSDPSGTTSDEVRGTLEEVEDILWDLERRFSELERSINALASLRLTEKQRRILRWLGENKEREIVYTRLVDLISREFRMPKSTARWNLRILREAALLEAGDRRNKGLPVRLTEAGRIALLDLSNAEDVIRALDQ